MKNEEKYNSGQEEFEGYPLYPASEDIFNQATRVTESIPQEESLDNKIDSEADGWNEKGYDEELSGDDLDIPGAELDDDQEALGSEDEENNYYSIGGDNHNDLEESNLD